MRIALGVEYDGTNFFGWQLQKHTDNTVQFVVEQALSKVADSPVQVICAGRTDTGVHGAEQVVHFDTEAVRTMRSWVLGANSQLPDSVCILWATPVADDFHARYKATRRRYQYVIINRPVRPTYLANRTSWEYRPLDVDRMQQAGNHLLGEHDFTSFRAVACQAKTPVRNLYELRVRRQGDFVTIDIEADGFLHHMVRNIAGVLMDIGAGKSDPEWAKDVLEHCDRTLGGVTAHPHGLYLMKITYPPLYTLPQLSRTDALW